MASTLSWRALTRAACLVAAAACATARTSGPTPTEEPAATTRREVLRGGAGLAGIVEYHPTANRARVLDLRARPDSLWPRVLAAYPAAGLPIGEVDTRARSVGTSSVRAVGRLFGARPSDYVDCGPGALGSAAADTYVLTVRVTTELAVSAADTTTPASNARAGDAYTTVRTLVAAVAKANGTQGDPVDCVSTGRLETRLVRLIAPPASAVPQP